MSQGSLVITDGTGAEVLQKLNAALSNLSSLCSGTTDPATYGVGVLPYSLWLDTSPLPSNPAILRQRNLANNGWVIVGIVGQEYLGLIPSSKIGAPNGIPELDANGKVPIARLYSSIPYGLFSKIDPNSPAFIKTGNGSVSIKAGTNIYVGGSLVSYGSDTAVLMPSLTAGTDYAIWVKDDATIQATTSFTSIPSAGIWRKVGGFHYAPGGNAIAQSGGNTTPQINQYSFYDPQWRPSSQDPRGMACINGAFWRDIYKFNTNPDVNGTSKYNQVIADGASPPKIPALLGGNGISVFTSFTWFEASRIAGCYGKRLITLDEQIISAFGTTEASSIGTDQVNTVWNAAYVSKFGINQASGVMWDWLANRGGAYNTGGWSADTNGFGSSYNAPNAAIGGGNWSYGLACGSSASIWDNPASNSNSLIGASFGCGHLNLAL